MASDAELDYVAERAAERAAERVASRAVTHDDVKKIVEEITARMLKDTVREVALVAVNDTLTTFGLDPKDRIEIMKDFAYLREFRKLSADTRKHVLFAVLTAIVGGILVAIWAGFRYNMRIP